MCVRAENEIDQDAFTELNDDEIKGMVKPLGVVKKLIRLRMRLVGCYQL